MKRVIVIDNSAVVRETIALVLGSDFVVLKRPHASGGDLPDQADEKIDLLIFGVTPTLVADMSSLLRLAAQARSPVLFLVDSKTAVRALEGRGGVAGLAKPFSPYELLERVNELLAGGEILPSTSTGLPGGEIPALHRYLAYPYLDRPAAGLIHRYATSRLPVLILGEVGCGMERVARAIFSLQTGTTPPISLNGAEISADFLGRKALELPSGRNPVGRFTALLIEDLDRTDLAGQSLLLEFLQREEGGCGGWALVTTSRSDLLEKVYRREFLDDLYYKVATLTLKLLPLRERRDDIATLAGWFAEYFARILGLGEVTFSTDAMERLSNYLWFGNLGELETVVGRTLATHRKTRVEISDLVFDFPSERPTFDGRNAAAAPSTGPNVKSDLKLTPDRSPAYNGSPVTRGNGDTRTVDLNVMIHELAHELKNPMVTIKTFAQLLEDRYQDENFRARFQDVVGSDIERMDDLLEVMIEFADFSQPRVANVPLEEKLRTALSDASSEWAKRQTSVRWKRNGFSREIRTDEAQLKYVLKNTLLAVLSQAKMGSEVEIDVEKQGCLTISYLREGARLASITHYFSASAANSDEAILPLRMLLAKQLVERNGGRMTVERADKERDVLRLEFPIA